MISKHDLEYRMLCADNLIYSGQGISSLVALELHRDILIYISFLDDELSVRDGTIKRMAARFAGLQFTFSDFKTRMLDNQADCSDEFD